MAKLNKLITLSVLYALTCSFSHAKIKRNKITPSVTNLKKKIKVQSRTILGLNREITSLERNLGKNSKRYLQVIDKRKEIETKIYETRQLTKKNGQLLELHLNESKKLLTKAVLNSLAETEAGAELISKKLLTDLLSKKIFKIRKQIDSNKKREKEVEHLLVRFRDFSQNESDLSSLLVEMEEKKKRLANKYLLEVKKKESLQAKYSKSKRKVISKRSYKKNYKSSITLRFFSPLEEYTGIEYNKKGITYSFKGQKAVTSTQAGTIAYAGSLSNYGNVIMIDHGKETRSVILGQYVPKVKKGQKVRVGDILGYTKSSYSSPGVQGKLYFEVRKKNKAQNTIPLMKKQFLVKNNFTNKK